MLDLIADFPDGPFCEVPESFVGGSGYGVKKGYTVRAFGWCPACGGRLGRYRPELVAAYRAHCAAADGKYAALLKGKQDLARWRSECQQLGATLFSEGDMQVVFVEPATWTQLVALWDYDHDCWYASAEFVPRPEWVLKPFLPQP
jgi:hypothetical protein